MRSRSTRTILLTALVFGLAACGTTDPAADEDVTGSPSPVPSPLGTHRSATPGDTTTPTPERTDPTATVEGEAGETVTLRDGDTVAFDGLRVTLLSATGPGEDCHDCPIQADLEVTDGSETERLSFSFSGNMAPGLAEEARTETVFGWRLRIDRIVDGAIDLTATRT